MRNLRGTPFLSLLLLCLLIQNGWAIPGPFGPTDEQPTEGRGPAEGVVSSLTSVAMLEGLVAYYPFNGNASDASGNQHDGIVHGAVLSTDRFGIPNSAYSFNGVNAYIEVPHDAALNPQNAITFTGWFQANTLYQYGNILSKGNDVSFGFYVARLHPPPLNLGLGIMFTQDQPSLGPTSVNPSNISLSVGQWYSFAVTYDGQMLCSYVDGVLIKSLAVSKTLGSNQGPLAIGKHPLSGYEYWFNGKIDDVRLYNRALSTEEIHALYVVESGSTMLQGLVAYYPFNGNASDASGNQHTGIVHGAVLSTDRFGIPNSAYAFNGVNAYIEVPHAATLHPQNAITYTGWFQANSVTQVGNILSKGSDVSFGFYVARLHPSPINLGLGIMFTQDQPTVGPTSANPSSISISVGQWYFFALTYDGQTLCSYVDGVLIKSLPVTKTLGSNQGPLAIGKHPLPGYEYWFNGKIDDVRLYDRALSANEISSLYQEGALRVTLFDAENWGQPGADARVVLYDANATQRAQRQADSASQVSFSNIEQGSGYYYRVYVYRPSPWGEQFWGEKTGITIPGNQTVSESYTRNTPYLRTLSVYIDSTNEELQDGGRRVVKPGTRLRIECEAKNPDAPGALPVSAFTGLYLDRDKILPYDASVFTPAQSYAIGATKNIVFYCDAPSKPGDYYLSVGARASSSRYDTALTDASGWHEPAFSVGTGIVAYYPFNGNANDASGNGSHGTIVGGVTPAIDRFGQANKAYAFDGSTGYIDVPSSNHPLGNVTITYSCWIKPILESAPRWRAIIDAGVISPYNRSSLMDETTNSHTVAYSVEVGWVRFNYVPLQNQWTHLVLTKQGNTVSLYANGNSTTQSTGMSINGQNVTSTKMRMGAPTDGGIAYYRGILDDVRIYERALNVNEIQDLYHEGGYALGLLPPWKYSNTGTSHTIIIPGNSNPNINGNALTAGDYIGVFHDSSGTLSCAGYERWTGTGSIALSAFGDDPTSGAKDGFSAGEAFRWKIFRASDGTMYDAAATYAPVGGVVTHTNAYATNGISQLASLAGGAATQCLNLRAGWSLMSSSVTPQKTLLDSIFKPVLGDVIIVKNGAQKTYIPSVPVNSIGSWVNTEGYQIKMANARSLCITGQKIAPQALTIGLPRGWSIMPYVRDNDMSIVSALSGVVGDVVIVKDQDGKAYLPSAGVDGIVTLRAGQAYQIKMANTRSIEYPASTPPAGTLETSNSTNSTQMTAVVPPWFYSNTGMSHTIIIPATVTPSVDGAPLVAGDFVGVFYDSSGSLACAGYAACSGTVPLAVSALGDDATTTVKDGLAPGETFRWKIWRQRDNHEFTATALYSALNGFGGIVTDSSSFTANGISAVSALIGSITGVNSPDIPAEHTLMQNYPNPFNPSTRIRYGLPRSSHVTLTVLNTVGQSVAILVDGTQEAGYHEIQFDASGLSSGIYFYKIKAGDFVQTRKLLLLR